MSLVRVKQEALVKDPSAVILRYRCSILNLTIKLAQFIFYTRTSKTYWISIFYE